MRILQPSDPEYQRIQRDAASAFGDAEPAAAQPRPKHAVPKPAGDLGDQVVAIMEAHRAGRIDVRSELSDAPQGPDHHPAGDLGDQVVALMGQRRAHIHRGGSDDDGPKAA